jgi:hypothetical protein
MPMTYPEAVHVATIQSHQPSGLLSVAAFPDASGLGGNRLRKPKWPENLIAANESSMI